MRKVGRTKIETKRGRARTHCSFTTALLALLLAVPGCSIKKLTANKLADALSAGGTTFSSDEDPELIRAAVPFSLKLMESVLSEAPDHPGLLLATASGFTQYAYAFVQLDADEREDADFTTATAMRARAGRLYLRARNYGLRGLETRYPDIEKKLRESPISTVRNFRRKDVPLIYWTGVSWAAAIASAKDNPDLIGDLPIVEALMDRALTLDEAYDKGAIHTFFITYEMSRSSGSGDPIARAKQHFDRAMSLADGKLAAPLVSYAESVCIPHQDKAGFESLLNQALAIDVNALPEHRLANLITQGRARWLLEREDKYFLNSESTTK